MVPMEVCSYTVTLGGVNIPKVPGCYLLQQIALSEGWKNLTLF